MPTRRIPHLGHALLFLVLLLAAFLTAEGIVLGIAGAFQSTHAALVAMQDQRLQILSNMLCYVLALGFCWITFPALWHRSFLDGIQWNAAGAWARFALPSLGNVRIPLPVAGLFLGFAAQAVSALLPIPKDVPMEELFRNPALIWLLALFGTLLAPLFEEIFFRGFLLPGIAIAVDYLSLPKPADPIEAIATLDAWRESDAFSAPALMAASIITSICFGLIHAPQLGFTWPAVCLLVTVSLALCYVRIRFRSVAATTLIHMSYNLSVFITLFIATGGFRHMERAV